MRYGHLRLRFLHRQLRDPSFERKFCSHPPPSHNVKEFGSNPGMTTGQFRALFRSPQGKMRHPRYKLRWDWHLRNFLTALIPPAAMLVFFKLVALLDKPHIQLYETRFEGKDPITGKYSVLPSPGGDSSPDRPSQPVEEEELHVFLRKLMQDRLKPLEEELKRLELLTNELIRKTTEKTDGSARIEEARQISKGMMHANIAYPGKSREAYQHTAKAGKNYVQSKTVPRLSLLTESYTNDARPGVDQFEESTTIPLRDAFLPF
ncbi:hypothetical protein FGB62_40g142 [Gracilaria domingensis]|nr:hypothetical protein FGB62_40g142 [Gracilaria domingensis]